MRFTASAAKENITYENSDSESSLKVRLFAIAIGTKLPLRDEQGAVVATFEANEALIQDAVLRSRCGLITLNHNDPIESRVGVFSSVSYENGFVINGEVTCPRWKDRIVNGQYTGISVEGKIEGEMANPSSMEIYAVSVLSEAEGACPLVDSEGNPVCRVEVIRDESESIDAANPILVINDNSIQGEHMTKKEEKIKAEASVAEIIPVVEVETPEIVASVPEAVVEAAVVVDAPAVAAPVIEVPAPTIVEKTLDWSLVSQELGIKSKDEFMLIKESTGKLSSLEEKINTILKENESLKSFKIETEKNWLKQNYPPGVVSDIAASHAEFVRDPVGFVQKYAEDSYKFKAASSVKLQGSAAESEITEEVKKMQARKEKRDKFLSATGGPAVR